MAFAIPFMRKFEYLQDDVQLNINYAPNIKGLDNFIKEYHKHRINIKVSTFDYQVVKTIAALREANPGVNIIAAFDNCSAILEKWCHQTELPHYYTQLVNNIDLFTFFLSLDVTDIFITGELCFNLPSINALAAKHNKSLRCYCNVCQADGEIPSIKTFFIRPEDILLYSEFIDTFEFYSTEKMTDTWLNTMYRIYAKDHKWAGKLNEIIPSFKDDTFNNYLFPKFGEKRIDCKKKCLYDPDKCHLCERMVELGNTLKSHSIAII